MENIIMQWGGGKCERGIDSQIVCLDALALHARLIIEVHLQVHTIVIDMHYAKADMFVGTIGGHTNGCKSTCRCVPSVWCLLTPLRVFGLACKQMWLAIT